MKTYFISDLHLGHANCIRFDNRPWETAEEMDMEIVGGIARFGRKIMSMYWAILPIGTAQRSRIIQSR